MLLVRSTLVLLVWMSLAVAQPAQNQDYALGRKAESAGDFAAATANYQAVVARNSVLKDYAQWRLARLARLSGDLVLERERLQQLLTTAPNSLLRDSAALRLSESFFESADFEAAANSAKALSQSKNVPVAREAAALMGTAYVRANKIAEARDTFTKLVMQMPDAARPDDFALTAVRGLDALDKSGPPNSSPQPSGSTNPPPSLSEADHLLRASVYQFNRDFVGARPHYQALIAQYPQSTTVPNAMLQLGRGYYLEYKYDDAIKAFQRVIDTYPQNDAARDALGFLGSTFLRTKRTDDAIATYKLLTDRFPNSPTPERPFLNIIDALHEAGRYPEALNWVQQTRARFKSSIGDTLALFAQMRIHLAQSSWAAAVNDAEALLQISDLGGMRVPGGTSAVEVSFLRAYALEQLGRTEDAIAAYLAIPDGRNEYYGARATQRLLALGGGAKSRAFVQMRLNALVNEAKTAGAAGQWEQARMAAQAILRLTTDAATRQQALQTLQSAYAALSAYRLPTFNQIPLLKPSPESPSKAEILLSLELYDEALPEILAARTATKSASPSDEDYTIAKLSLQAGLPNRAVRFAEQVWKGIPGDFVMDLAPRDLVEMLYPVPFRESLLKHASSRSVDPRFVLSIARQESRFQPEAKSVAAARGLMQFIPATANDIATALKFQNFAQDDLYNADTAILFGSAYLADLFKQFPDQPQAVAGAYNGGADNLVRWIARSRSNDPDRYVAEIGFSQTKDYVYKVLSNFWTYQRLYDAQLQPIAGATNAGITSPGVATGAKPTSK